MTGNPNGRPPDPETQAEAQSYAERFVSKRIKKYLQVLDDIAQNEDTAADQRRMAISTLFERGLGKPAVPERDDQLGKLAEVLKQIARISGQKSNPRVIESAPRGALSSGEDGPDRDGSFTASE
jgi:hypothetical protein